MFYGDTYEYKKWVVNGDIVLFKKNRMVGWGPADNEGHKDVGTMKQPKSRRQGKLTERKTE